MNVCSSSYCTYYIHVCIFMYMYIHGHTCTWIHEHVSWCMYMSVLCSDLYIQFCIILSMWVGFQMLELRTPSTLCCVPQRPRPAGSSVPVAAVTVTRQRGAPVQTRLPANPGRYSDLLAAHHAGAVRVTVGRKIGRSATRHFSLQSWWISDETRPKCCRLFLFTMEWSLQTLSDSLISFVVLALLERQAQWQHFFIKISIKKWFYFKILCLLRCMLSACRLEFMITIYPYSVVTFMCQ